MFCAGINQTYAARERDYAVFVWCFRPQQSQELVHQFTGKGSTAATKRLLHDYKKAAAMDESLGIRASPIGDNFYHWRVEFFNFEEKSGLGQDLVLFKNKHGLVGFMNTTKI